MCFGFFSATGPIFAPFSMWILISPFSLFILKSAVSPGNLKKNLNNSDHVKKVFLVFQHKDLLHLWHRHMHHQTYLVASLSSRRQDRARRTTEERDLGIPSVLKALAEFILPWISCYWTVFHAAIFIGIFHYPGNDMRKNKNTLSYILPVHFVPLLHLTSPAFSLYFRPIPRCHHPWLWGAK